MPEEGSSYNYFDMKTITYYGSYKDYKYLAGTIPSWDNYEGYFYPNNFIYPYTSNDLSLME
jgi:hypothetical protein